MNPVAPQLLMLLVVAAALALLVWIAVRASRRRSIRLPLAVLSGMVVIYLGGLLAASAEAGAADLTPGELKCFDEWCAGLVTANVASGPSGLVVQVRLENHGRTAQRSILARAFVEADGRRLPPRNPDALQVLVPPGQEIELNLDFDLPSRLNVSRFVLTEATSGALTPGLIVIGDEASPLHPLVGWPLKGLPARGVTPAARAFSVTPSLDGCPA